MNANGRRYKQALNKFKHLDRRKRPNYKMRDLAAARRHNDALLAKERRIASNKAKKAKK